MTIRTLLVDLDVPDGDTWRGRWSSTQMSEMLSEKLGYPVHVWGQIDEGSIDATHKKIGQWARELEQDASKGDQRHSSYKAQSFFRDIWPTKFFERWTR